MLVKNTHVTQAVGETNVWTPGQMHNVLYINMWLFVSWTISINHPVGSEQWCGEFWTDLELNNDEVVS